MSCNLFRKKRKTRRTAETVVSARELWFKYDKDLPDVVKGLSLELHKGEFLALLGGNGTGKTTTLKLLASLKKPYRGELTITRQRRNAAAESAGAVCEILPCAQICWRFLPKAERKSERLAQVVSLCKSDRAAGPPSL